MAELEKEILNGVEEKPIIWWRYIDNIFFLIWKHREESVEKFVNKLNSFHLTIEFTVEYSKETIRKIGKGEFIKSNFFC